MVYDEARHQLLLFGGTGTEDGQPSGDRGSTWSWDGQRWTRISTTGPSSRSLASLTYDAGRQRVVLYGGQTGAFPNITVLHDTWEWDGTSWSQRATTGPSTRVHQVLAYDRARGTVVLYGGFSLAASEELRDIWEWDGSAWTQQPDSTAANLANRGIAYDEKASVLYLYSVVTGTSTVVMDVWNGDSLVRSPVAGPGCVPVQPQLAALGPTRGGVLFYSGSCGAGQATPETWCWDGLTWTAVSGPQPPFRLNAALAYDRDRDRVVLYGGEVGAGTPDLADTWEFDGATWNVR